MKTVFLWAMLLSMMTKGHAFPFLRSISSSLTLAMGLQNKEMERALKSKGHSAILGIDEAGRGCLAGPVVCGGVICLDDEIDERILEATDSKKISETKRRLIYDIITTDTDRYMTTYSVVDHAKIDEMNILQATMSGMEVAIRQLVEQFSAQQNQKFGSSLYAIVDGNKVPAQSPISTRALVKGDSLCLSVALASIVAKVKRDEIMVEYHDQYPEYNFAKHKGYPTREHVLAIGQYGASDIHRLTFKPLKGVTKRSNN